MSFGFGAIDVLKNTCGHTGQGTLGRLLSSETPRCMPTPVHAYPVPLPEGETMHPFADRLLATPESRATADS